MQFVHQALTWGFLLALAPLLIHLINMMRHQRVKWAAMDFLLQSYKKHRKWVWLKQLLLLLARMAAIALLVAMLAQWVTRDQWLDLFSAKQTHHFVLLDDSYSMSDRSGASSAMDSARQVVGRIVSSAAESETFCQKLTLIRLSRAARMAAAPAASQDASAPDDEAKDDGAQTDAAQDERQAARQAELARLKVEQTADFNAEILDSNFGALLEEKRTLFETTQLASGPREALVLLRQLLEKGSKDRNVVYLVSDFREKDWENPAELRETMRDLEKGGAEIHLVNCVKTTQQNLGITDLRASSDTRAAGVPLFVYVDVTNHGTSPAKNVQLRVRTIHYPPDLAASADVDNAEGKVEELPTVLVETIKPGETVTSRVQVFFPTSGQHAVEATLPDDPVAADNRRWTVVEFPEGEPVLLIDGSDDQSPSYYLTSVFQPGQRANTGIRPVVKPAAWLRDVTPEDLASYRGIYLLDVPSLEKKMIENLQAYVEGGGGLAVFVGERVQVAAYNKDLYAGGQGLLPLKLGFRDVLPPKNEDSAADLDVTDHPVFEPFLAEANSFIRLVAIESYLKPDAAWTEASDPTSQVIARLRNRQPLVVEKKRGEGTVVLFLTSLTPEWNNWAGDPSFIVTQLKLQSYLAAVRRTDPTQMVGSPLRVNLDAARYRPEIKFVSPGARNASRVVIERTATRPKENSPAYLATLGPLAEATDETIRGGVYEAWPSTLAGAFEPRRYAMNVDPQEGVLTTVDIPQLVAKLAPVKAKFHDAESFDWELGQQAGFNRSVLLMALLIVLLLGEQFLAYLLSYHPPMARSHAATGVAR